MTSASTPLRVLVTRPREDAVELVQRLEDAGVEVVEEPLLDIRFRDVAAPDLRSAQGLVFTSANGVRAFARRSEERGITAFAVGDATARRAREAGFMAVESAGGNVDDLAALIVHRAAPEGGKLVHIAGSAVAGELSERLVDAGFAIERYVMYDARAADRLSTRTISALKRGDIDAVLMFSPRTARAFAGLAERYGLTQCFGRMAACCLSEAVAGEIRVLNWQSVFVAREPTLEALLDVVKDVRLSEYDG